MRIDRNQINQYQKIQQPGGVGNNFKQSQEINIKKLKTDQIYGITGDLMHDDDEVAYFEQTQDYKKQNQSMTKN